MEKEKAAMQLQLCGKESQEHAYLIQIDHLKSEITEHTQYQVTVAMVSERNAPIAGSPAILVFLHLFRPVLVFLFVLTISWLFLIFVFTVHILPRPSKRLECHKFHSAANVPFYAYFCPHFPSLLLLS